MRASAGRTRRPGARRRAGRGALVAALLGLAGTASAQVVATLGIASADRWRGVATDGDGPVLRASVMADAPWEAVAGAYAGLAGLWRTRDAGLASIEALAGWSGRFDAIPAWRDADPRWGWDVGVHHLHYGEGARYDFNEAMAGLLAPGWSARAWYAPHYFGGPWSSLYGELDASRPLSDAWRVFGHVGRLRYGASPGGRPRVPGRTDALAGVAYAADRWELRLTFDGLLSGRPFDEIDDRHGRTGWVLGANIAF